MICKINDFPAKFERDVTSVLHAWKYKNGITGAILT